MKLKPVGNNQTELTINDDLIILFSYETPVACVLRSNKTGKYEFYQTEKFHSHTTSKHINQFLAKWDTLLRHTTSQEFFHALVK